MKLIYTLLIASQLLYGAPSWFYNIEPTQKNELIGYGIDEDLSKAKQKAIASIVESISVNIQSSLNISSSDKNGEIQSNSSSDINSRSSAVLSGVEIIRSVEEDDKWYVAVKYDNSPLPIKLKNQLPKNIQNEKQNNYLKNTPLFKYIYSEVNKKLDFQIIRKDNLWQLKYKDIILPLSQDDFYKLFRVQNNETITIKANKRKYEQNDQMYFDIKHKIPGYISILYVEHNGKIGVLLANHKSDKSFTFPDIKSEDSFSIVNPYKKPIKELYIAIYGKNKIALDEFEAVSDDMLDSTNFNFHKLISKLDEVKYSSYIIKIKE